MPTPLLHHAFERQARLRPHAEAVRAAPGLPGPGLTYCQLERRSRAAARPLLDLPVGARVGVWMRKSPAAVAAQLAILRAGGCYVPFDPLAPAARVAALAADARLAALFADPDLAALAAAWPQAPPRLPPPGGEADADAGSAREGEIPPLPRRGPADPAALAYILYTSGSTGAPKGVMLSHAHALNFVAAAARITQLSPADRVASHAPFHFDLSIFDLWASLSRGACVCLLDPVTARFPSAVAAWIEHQRISVWYSVPAALQQLLGPLRAAAFLPARSLRAVLFAGEPFPAAPLRALRRGLPGARWHNWYGPTETNVCCGFPLPPLGPAADPATDRNAPLPIGRAWPGFELALLDAEEHPVAEGESGFLWARGAGVMRGYWGDPARTAAVLRHPAGLGGGTDPWYNTGDLARRGPSGDLYFEGRRDDLVKCRGYRISLLEVENALAACPGVRQAAVIALPAGAPDRLEAFLAAGDSSQAAGDSGQTLDLDMVRRHLALTLPAYMIPERFHLLDELPRTSTGKLDRQRLPAACASAPREADARAASEAPAR